MAAPMFRKKAGGKRDVRTREAAATASASATDQGPDEDDEASTVVRKKHRGATGLGHGLRHPGTVTRKGAAGGRDEDEDGDSDGEWRLDRYGESSVGSVVRSNKATGDLVALDNRADATRQSDWYDEGGNSGVLGTPAAGKEGTNNDDGVYRGTSSYNTFITPRDEGISSKLKAATKGPIKAGNNVRTISVVDYQPDVCKDYKETGYCGFGDTCKFMHDRSDYLAGWQLDALPTSAARQRGGDGSDEDEVEEEEIPFACLLCRKPFTDPIVTKCGHYFCSACAIKRFGKTSKCFACGKQTQGIFNSAGKVLERMEKARKVREEEREQKRWNRGDQEGAQASDELLEGVEIAGPADEEDGVDEEQ